MVASVSALISPAPPLLMNASRFILLKMYFLPASSASCTNGLAVLGPPPRPALVRARSTGPPQASRSGT